MKTKPTVFLSHSSVDKTIIERIYNDLRACRIDGWHAEWEIPSGESFRKTIFEEGIPNCDCFFVYLTESSLDSHWVKKELDAAFVEQSREKGCEFITFVGSEDVRIKLPSDLASLHSPLLNDDNYDLGFRKLLVRVFEAKVRRAQRERSLESENELLKLRLENEQLKREMATVKARADDNVGLARGQMDELKAVLDKMKFPLLGKELSALEAFYVLTASFSGRAYLGQLSSEIRRHCQFGRLDAAQEQQIRRTTEIITARLALESLVEGEDFGDLSRGQRYYFTDLGKEFARFLGREAPPVT